MEAHHEFECVHTSFQICFWYLPEKETLVLVQNPINTINNNILIKHFVIMDYHS